MNASDISTEAPVSGAGIAKKKKKIQLSAVEIQNTGARKLKEAARRNNLKHRASKKERYHHIRSNTRGTYNWNASVTFRI